MSLRIRTIARLTGIREATLRAWERRYGFPRPHRSENNYRAYGREQVEDLRRVARLMDEGLSVSEAIAQVRTIPLRVLPVRERVAERFWSAVMVLDGDEAARVLDEGQQDLDALEACDALLLPLLRELSSRLDIAREHLASALIRERLRALLHAEPGGLGTGPRAVLACAPQDHHEGGLLALALHLKRQGWRLTLLGADTPVEALRSACAQVHPDVVALSCVRHREPEELQGLLASAVAACLPVPVVVGGTGARERLRAVFAAGAHYADSADELKAVLEQLRPAQVHP